MKVYLNNNLHLNQKFTYTFTGKNPVKPLILQNLLLPDKAHCVGYIYNSAETARTINFEKLKTLGIPNLYLVENKGVRGESLSPSRNFVFLSKLKENGIDTIIDLRTADYTEKFRAKCENLGLNYLHFPVDEKTTHDRAILNSLPEFFEQIKKGKFYISCAQGRHRTDIALAINYIFNPEASSIPPKMHGHIKSGNFRCQDIFTRINSLYKAMTVQDKAKLGWTEEFEKNFSTRKKLLKSFNEHFI